MHETEETPETRTVYLFQDAPGWTAIRNEVFDILMPKMAPAEFKLLMAILRKTKGWRNPSGNGRKVRDAISYSQLHELTGLSDSGIARWLPSLERRGLIRSYKTRGKTTTYFLNLAYSIEVEEAAPDPAAELEAEIETLVAMGTPPLEEEASDDVLRSENDATRTSTLEEEDLYLRGRGPLSNWDRTSTLEEDTKERETNPKEECKESGPAAAAADPIKENTHTHQDTHSIIKEEIPALARWIRYLTERGIRVVPSQQVALAAEMAGRGAEASEYVVDSCIQSGHTTLYWDRLERRQSGRSNGSGPGGDAAAERRTAESLFITHVMGAVADGDYRQLFKEDGGNPRKALIIKATEAMGGTRWLGGITGQDVERKRRPWVEAYMAAWHRR